MKNLKWRIVFVTLFSLAFSAQAVKAEQTNAPKASEVKDIKAYCLDFNWGDKGFAAAGTWKDANPAAHLAWYKATGANVIQTFCVSCNGYAWYKNGVVPEQPGLKYDFLRDLVKLGHQEGMLVLGYFCISANTRWGQENPTLSYGTPSTYHIPYTDEYLAYLSAAITDAVKTTGIDGFMIDWVWQPNRKANEGKWLDAEKKLYQQLMGEPFPGEDKLTKEQDLAYSRKAIDRCWKTIRKAAKDVNPACIIWLTTNNMKHPHVVNSDMYREVDWLLAEAGRIEEFGAIKSMVGTHTRLTTCFADWNGQDAAKVVPEALAAGIGLYGFAKPMGKEGTINLDKLFPRQLSELTGNDRNIAALARAYRGKSMDSEWVNNDFVEPAVPPAVRITLKRRGRGWSDTAKLTFEKDLAIIAVRTPYQTGRAQLARTGDKWPSTILIRLGRKNPDTPGPTHFRIANGKIGASIIQAGETKVIAGEMQGGLDLNKVWEAKPFLNEGNPASPVKLENVQTKTTPEDEEITVPAKLLEGNPEMLCFEWCNGDKVR
jgi:hypothetical protein